MSGKNKKKRNRTKAASSGSYDVGYGKPPKHTQYPPGHSGNLDGRPKNSKSIERLVYETGLKNVKMSIQGEIVEMPMIEAAINKLWELALKGDTKAWKILSPLFDQKEAEIAVSSVDNDRYEFTQARLFATALMAGIPFDEVADLDLDAATKGYAKLCELKHGKPEER